MKSLKLILLTVVFLVVGVPADVLAEQAPTPRTIGNNNTARTTGGTSSYSRSAPNVRTSGVTRLNDSGDSNFVGRVARSAVRNINNSLNSNVVTPIVRGARGGSSEYVGRDMSRAATVARATAVFSDVSKIGSGYAACRDAYASCMDQFCANANDTYRRCFCSDKFTEFRNTEDKLDKAITLLAEFEDNSLNAVDKTAAEVKAMYSASEGERAIKKDTTAASKMLSEIENLLSGKASSTNSSASYKSVGLIDVNFSANLGDIWSGTTGASVFGFGGGTDLSTLEGSSLYNSVNNQCLQLVADSCENSAVTNMAKSSYSILISQDCNAYAKKVDSKTEQVKQTVRTAEKYLREARLEEYRSHNSSDMNACITAVKSAVLADSACGTDYKHCLDDTGAFINNSTGDPIYSPRLFQLTERINLKFDGTDVDVLGDNPTFSKFLDAKRQFAAGALDSCRDIAEQVWREFKRTALIEIAQAQDEKIEEVKMSCVNTMTECYDTQTEALKSFDTATAGVATGLSIAAARSMCAEKVSACAALYSGEGDVSCEFDNNGKLNNPGKCGLTTLIKFVNTVDTVRVNEACDTALANKLHELCTPDSGEQAYPYKCRLTNTDAIRQSLMDHTKLACTTIDGGEYSADKAEVIISNLMDEFEVEMNTVLAGICESLDGTWFVGNKSYDSTYQPLTAFYSRVSGGIDSKIDSWGRCVESSVKVDCNMENERTGSKGYVTYNERMGTCSFAPEYYELRCKDILGAIWSNNICYIDE
ncbi:MAG: hypothetical protein KBS86_02240 [Proteobacteria bacterium]|nr:hypothetical protein [Candidatus Enterousia scatequi]